MADYSGLKYWEGAAFLLGAFFGIMFTRRIEEGAFLYLVLGIVWIGGMILLLKSMKWRRRVKKLMKK